MAVGARINEDRSLGRLFRDLSADTVAILRQEIDLAKTEVSEKIAHVGAMGRDVGIGAGLAVGGGLALLAALILGLTSLLSKFMSPWVAMWLAPLIGLLTLRAIHSAASVASTMDTRTPPP